MAGTLLGNNLKIPLRYSVKVVLEVSVPESLKDKNPDFTEDTIVVVWNKARSRLVTAFLKGTYKPKEEREVVKNG